MVGVGSDFQRTVAELTGEAVRLYRKTVQSLEEPPSDPDVIQAARELAFDVACEVARAIRFDSELRRANAAALPPMVRELLVEICSSFQLLASARSDRDLDEAPVLPEEALDALLAADGTAHWIAVSAGQPV